MMNDVPHASGKIKVVPITHTASNKIRHWFQDQEVTKYNSHGKLMKPPPDFDSIDPEKQIIWAVCAELQQWVSHAPVSAGMEPAGHKHIGNVMLEIDWINRSAEFSCIFGEKKYWGKGYATKAIRQLFEHGFDKLNLHKIWLGTPVTNGAMAHIAENLGMIEEGMLTDQMFLEGEYVDVARFGILRSDWGHIKILKEIP